MHRLAGSADSQSQVVANSAAHSGGSLRRAAACAVLTTLANAAADCAKTTPGKPKAVSSLRALMGPTPGVSESRSQSASSWCSMRPIVHQGAQAAALLDDPDAGPLPGLLNEVEVIVYAALKSSTEIYVDGHGVDGYVPGPAGWRPCSGIAVDQHYLWTWGWGGPACATHASVMKCLAERLEGRLTTPRWIQNQVPAALKHIYPQYGDVPEGRTGYGYVPANQSSTWSDTPPPPKGLTDLCACDDGSLFAGVYERTAEKAWSLGQGNYWAVKDTLALYSGVYAVHLKEGTMDVDWKVISTSPGVRIQKLPIHCWPAITSTIRLIEQLAPVLR